MINKNKLSLVPFVIMVFVLVFSQIACAVDWTGATPTPAATPTNTLPPTPTVPPCMDPRNKEYLKEMEVVLKEHDLQLKEFNSYSESNPITKEKFEILMLKAIKTLTDVNAITPPPLYAKYHTLVIDYLKNFQDIFYTVVLQQGETAFNQTLASYNANKKLAAEEFLNTIAKCFQTNSDSES